jgi:hypothetical protein
VSAKAAQQPWPVDPKEDMAEASLTLVAAEEEVDRIRKALAVAIDHAKWAKVNHTAAVLAYRSDRRHTTPPLRGKQLPPIRA